MGGDYRKGLYRDYERLTEAYAKLDKEHNLLKYNYRLQEQQIECLKKREAEMTSEIEALKKEVARLTALRDADGNNSGLSTAKTPIHKKKRIPNSRPKTDKHIGGQPGHTQRKLEPFKDDEVTEHEVHREPVCPECGGELEQLEDEATRDELDYEVTVRKVRHHFPNCRCKNCGKTTCARALILALANDGNASKR